MVDHPSILHRPEIREDAAYDILLAAACANWSTMLLGAGEPELLNCRFDSERFFWTTTDSMYSVPLIPSYVKGKLIAREAS